MNVTSSEEPCPFCSYLRGESEAVFVSRGSKVSILLNPRQYERGALLVIPNEHRNSLIDTTDEQFLAVQLEARRMARLLVDHLGATGVNVFQNAGVHAGQTVPHYHVHVVPRYPASDPGKRFREADYPVTPVDQLQELAAELNAPQAAVIDSFLTLIDREYARNPKAWRAAMIVWTVVALAALARLVSTLGEESWSSPAFGVFSLAMLAGAVAQTAKQRRRLIVGYAVSLALFAVTVALTL